MEGARLTSSVPKAAAAYTLALLLCLAILTLTLGLWEADLGVPITYQGDALLAQLWIKGVQEHGWYLHNDALGAPTGHDMHDYMLMESGHFLLIKLLTAFTSKAGRIYNLFFLLTFPLTTLSSLFVLRRFAVPYAAALVASLLYTFLPYHFLRGLQGHLFLASYFLLPLVVMLILWIHLDQPFLFEQEPGRRLPKLRLFHRKLLLAVCVCILVSSTGAYYAFFACFFFLVAGLLAWRRRKTLAPMAAGLLLCTLVSVGAAANAAPSLLFKWNHGSNRQAVQRSLAGVEFYSLKLTQLLMPTSFHRLPSFAHFKNHYATRTLSGSDFGCLGVTGALGFLATMGWLGYRDPKRWGSELRDGLGAALLAALLLATVGGLGSILAFVIGHWIRCYERMSIYVAYFSFFTIALGLQEMALTRVKTRIGRLLYYGFLAILLTLGILDQTSPKLVPSYASLRKEYRNDANFVSRVEAAVPQQAMIFQLPYVPFPESPPVHRMTDYDHLRPYLHSKTLRWSYGAMRGREGDAWQKRISSQPLDQMVKTLAESGFAGIYLDRFGFIDQGAALESQLTSLLGSRPIVSDNQRLLFFSLAEYKRHLPPALVKLESSR